MHTITMLSQGFAGGLAMLGIIFRVRHNILPNIIVFLIEKELYLV